ncbi:MAG: septation protein IspZ, partial [Proteobacteria bacterium]|nr:septation protein IspZ [Pseudomonadota bacterium]
LYLLIASFLALIVAYFLTKKVAKVPLISAIILGIFGGLTIFSGNDLFIKMKPTLINLFFAIFLFVGYFMKKPLIKHLFGEAFKMKDEAWMILSLRWAWFFVFLAVLNEFIWRNFDTSFWVNFKVFGVFPISMIFTISQVPFIVKNMKKRG